MGGALGGIAKLATGGGGGLGAALLGGTKTGKLLGMFGGGGATPNPFGGLLNPVSGTGNVAPFTANVPTPGAGFGAFSPTPSQAVPTPQVQRGGYLSPPATPSTAVAQTRSQGSSPSQNEAFAYKYLRGKNLNPAAAAGIVGNLAQESSFAGDVLSGQRRGDQGASGFAAQWQGPRLRNLKAFAKSEQPSFPQQLDFIFEEANPKSPYFDAGAGRALSLLQNAQNPAQAADIFRDHFERPSAEDRGSRRGFAQRAFAAYGNMPGIQVQVGAGTGAFAGGVADYGTTISNRLFGGSMTPGPLEQMQGGAASQGGSGDFAFGGGAQAQSAEQMEVQQPVDLGAQEVAGVQSSLAQKRLADQQREKKRRTPQIGQS